MTPEQIRLVQESFEQITPDANVVAAMFYQRLFELDPTVRLLFKGDMKAQGAKLMKTLAVVVWGLNQTDKLIPVVEQLGQRHVAYGVQPGHYDTVGAALIWALREGLGEDFTPAKEAAWLAAYGMLSGIMQAAASRVSVAPA